MLKNKGFTLVELLAVIAILSLIVVFAMQPIINIFNESSKNAFKDSVYGILDAGESYYLSQQFNLSGMTEDKVFYFPDDTELKIDGSKPSSGTMIINKKGDISIAVTNGKYCITKSYEEKELTITEDIDNCYSSDNIKRLFDLATTSDIVTEVHECAKNGICEVGTKFVISVNENENQNFYVINDSGTEVTLLMDSILYKYLEQIPGQEEGIGGYYAESVKWISNDDYGCDILADQCQKTDKGPVTLLNKLKDMTSNWTNIPERLYIVSDDNPVPSYSNINIKSRARLLTYTEAINICGTECDEFIYSSVLTKDFNGSNSGDYWLSTSDSMSYAKTISYFGSPVYEFYFGSSKPYYNDGIRPVITLSK